MVVVLKMTPSCKWPIIFPILGFRDPVGYLGFFPIDWVDYNAVAFSMEFLEWGRTFSDFWGKKVLHIYG